MYSFNVLSNARARAKKNRMQKKITHFHKSKIKKKIPLRGSILVTELLQKFFQQLRQVFNVLGRHNND